MYDQQVKVCENQESEFQRLLSAMRDELESAAKIAEATANVAAILRPIQLKDKPKKESVERESGVLGALWNDVDRLKELNYYADITYSHLRSIIGN